MEWVLLFALLLSLAANGWLIWHVWRPVRRLSVIAIRLAEGELDGLEKSCGGAAEIDLLRRAMLAMTGHVQRAQEQSRAYTGALVHGQEMERQRLAHELHDDTVQALIAIGHSLDLARSAVQTNPASANDLLAATRAAAAQTAADLRDRIADLRPPALDELGLAAALRMLADTKIKGQVVQVEGAERRLAPTLELALFRTAQEALTNIQRHASAQKITLRLTYYSDCVMLSIQDDGRGFQAPPDLNTLAANGHFGLLGIQERLNGFGGALRIDSTTAQGTRLEARIPLTPIGQPTGTVRDPVCSALIHSEQAYGSVTYAGQTYYFCCPVCQGAFQREPGVYVNNESAAGGTMITSDLPATR